jgi:hypothetical protein
MLKYAESGVRAQPLGLEPQRTQSGGFTNNGGFATFHSAVSALIGRCWLAPTFYQSKGHFSFNLRSNFDPHRHLAKAGILERLPAAYPHYQ